MLSHIHSAYNRFTLKRIERGFSPYTEVDSGFTSPLLVSGAFRSGTSLVTRLLCGAGYDCGPETHLLQPKGRYRKYNPDGYFENYFFMELSRYIFHLTNSAGDDPPEEESLKIISEQGLDDSAFRKYAVLHLRESRVSNSNKERVLKCASVNNCAAYVKAVFGKNPIIKNPHFGVLLPWIENEFPASQHVAVFRNPDDWARSAKAVTGKADISLYEKYYRSHLHSSRVSGRVFINYDKLIESPEDSLQCILQRLGIHKVDVQKLASIVRRSDHSVKEEAAQSEIYMQLIQHSVNG